MLGQSITFTLSFFSKAVVVLEVCLGSLCWNTALRPSLRREGLMLCFSMSQYMLAFMVPSMNCRSPVPETLMQPQTMTLPSPCLTVGKTHLSLYSSPGCRHTRARGEGVRVRGGQGRTVVSDEIRATLVDHVLNHGLSMREAGQRAQPNLSH